MRLYIVLFLSNFLAFCSGDADYQGLPSDVSADSTSSAIDEEEDEEEEVTAIPPAVISGAHLACLGEINDTNEKIANVSCHLERDNKVVDDIPLKDSDFSAYDGKGESLAFIITQKSQGVYSLEVQLKSSDKITISVDSVDGVELSEKKEALINIKRAPEEEPAPMAAEIDDSQSFPEDINLELGELGKEMEAQKDDGVLLAEPSIQERISGLYSDATYGDLDLSIDENNMAVGTYQYDDLIGSIDGSFDPVTLQVTGTWTERSKDSDKIKYTGLYKIRFSISDSGSIEVDAEYAEDKYEIWIPWNLQPTVN